MTPPQTDDRQQRFSAIARQYRATIARVCMVYATDGLCFDDLYQETLINIWQGLNGYRGDARMSTWIYRAAINTCISCHRRNRNYAPAVTSRLSDIPSDIADTGSSRSDRDEDLQMLYALIDKLSPLDKALIMMWLDEQPYDVIGDVMGMTAGNVAVKIHRIKDRLSQLAKDL